MNFDELKTVWKNKYSVIFEQLDKVKKINSVATAFNTNIDAIYKIKTFQFRICKRFISYCCN